MNHQRANTGRAPGSDSPAIPPLLPALIGIYMAPILLLLAVGRGDIQLSFVDQHRVADIMTRRIRPSTIGPIGSLSIINPKHQLPIVPLPCVTIASGI